MSERRPGPLCGVSNPQNIQDGTLCRSLSPKPGSSGVVGPTPGIDDHLRPSLGGGAGHMAEEAWFENRYPNLLNNRKDRIIDMISSWIYNNWGQPRFDESVSRLKVRQTIYSRGSLRNDNEFEKQGDKPQSAFEADKVLGSFAIDVETPITIEYSTVTKSGRQFQKFRFSTVMYVEDVLGLQKHDPIYTRATGWLFPSRQVRRASWGIKAEGMSYLVRSGDSLSQIAQSIYGNSNQWKRIQAENRIPNADKIDSGERLRIPKPQ